MGDWKEHGSSFYNCNRFDEKSGLEARDAQARARCYLERYLHYYNRFRNHEQSAALEVQLYHRIERKMELMQSTTTLSWIDVQFLKDAVAILSTCRATLKHTYVLAFYLARNNLAHIFEDNQRDLELAVEQLSELLEKPLDPATISELHAAVVNKSVYVKTRRHVLLAFAMQQLREGAWEYNLTGTQEPVVPSSSSTAIARD